MVDLHALRTLDAILKIISIVLVVYQAYNKLREAKRRRRKLRDAKEKRHQSWFFKACIKQIRNNEVDRYCKAFRMNVKHYNLLRRLFCDGLCRTSNRERIPPEMQLALTIMHLSHGCSYKYLAWSFKINESIIMSVIYETCQAIWDELHPIYLARPKIIDWENISKKFHFVTGMPNCLGAMDGKLINITCPSKSGSIYRHQKSFSVVLLATCDVDFAFTMADIAAIDNRGDGGIFLRSNSANKIFKNTLPIPAAQTLPNTQIDFPYYFVAAGAFPLRPNIMRPFPGKNLPVDKNNYNKVLSNARDHVEIAFNILSSRWKILNTTIGSSAENIDKVILATIVLHNYLILEKDSIYYSANDFAKTTESNLPSFMLPFHKRSSKEAFELRNILKDYLKT